MLTFSFLLIFLFRGYNSRVEEVWWVGSLGGSQGQQLRGGRGVVQHPCVHYSGTASMWAAQWYITCVCSTVVQHLCVQYSGAAPVCTVQWYSTWVCSTAVQHLCVQYSGKAHVCAVQWYSTCVCSTVVQLLCVQCAMQFTKVEIQVAML